MLENIGAEASEMVSQDSPILVELDHISGQVIMLRDKLASVLTPSDAVSTDDKPSEAPVLLRLQAISAVLNEIDGRLAIW